LLLFLLKERKNEGLGKKKVLKCLQGKKKAVPLHRF
jgi:hypothetical protein